MLFSRRVVAFIWFVGLAYEAAVLPPDELESLKVIGGRLGKRDWNFDVDPCTRLSGWVTPNAAKGNENAVTCDCNFANATICHVVGMSVSSNFSCS